MHRYEIQANIPNNSLMQPDRSRLISGNSLNRQTVCLCLTFGGLSMEAYDVR